MADWNETIQSMNKTDELLAEITRLRALVAEAAAVIKPFAEVSGRLHSGFDDAINMGHRPFWQVEVRNLRAAAQWMEKKTNG